MSAYRDRLVTAAGEAERTRHRPTDPARLAAEIRRLSAAGLTTHDIAGALQIQPSEVLRLLATGSAA
ncbi:MAG TPA: hypothetical protein VGP20_02815 [Steroidobacteraceae bacterium]|jgi:hypothetical protein|nr:hypothetical protein [Steroidobacteraceae bacterium]